MKYHISVKFIAILLAALCLFTALGSGIGIFTLTALNLYENSVDDLYEENMASTRQNFAVNLVHRYASLNLGNLPEDYLNQYYGTHWQYDTFEYGSYYYTIFNEHDQIVENTVPKGLKDATRYVIHVTELNYRNAISVTPTGFDRYNGIPATEEPAETIEETITPEAETTIPAEISDTSEPATPITTPEEQADNAPEDATLDATVSSTVQESARAAAGIGQYQETEYYYDHESNRQTKLTYTIQELPPYTVALYLLPGAAPVEHAYSILRVVYEYRMELFWVLGVSILLFSVFSVYLCCAAGRKPGREEIRAGGLNRIPLDLHLGIAGFLLGSVLVFGFEAAEYLLRYSPKVLIPFLAMAGFGICLVVVIFCFAATAQFKTPNFYWWHNSLLGRCWKLTGRIFRWSLKAVRWIWHAIPAALHWCGQKIAQLYRICLKLAKKLLALLLAMLKHIHKWLLRLWAATKRGLKKLGKWLNRFFSLLPLTWQWLLLGCVLFLLVGMVFATNGEELLSMICFCIFAGIFLYIAHAFGILMEGARRMGKGDLETKVSDRFLLGCFQEFATDLNALADVAMVAAQKQMKSDRMKTELITNVSHDIKTPLTSIINYVDLLQKAETEEDREVCLEVLTRQSLQLKKLIEDLMEMSKASTGNMNVDIVPIDAVEAINQALGEFSDKLDRAQLTPIFRQPEAPIYMLADGRLAWRVLSNLLSNAVKYALPGTRVYIDLMELEDKVIISMKNISREPLNVSADELLERFVRGDASRNTEGSGLGLNIAQSLMEIQKGQLQLLVDGDLFKVTLIFPAGSL